MQECFLQHFATGAREWLNERFSEQWLGRCDLHTWLDRRLNSTPCDFLFGIG